MTDLMDTLSEQLYLKRKIVANIRYTRNRHPQTFESLEAGELFSFPEDEKVFVKTNDTSAFSVFGETEEYFLFPEEQVYGVSAADL